MRPIAGFPGYHASEDGNLWSCKGLSGRPKKLTGTPVNGGDGYLIVHLYSGGKKHRKYIHRVILETFMGECPSGQQCRHLDGDSRNNRLANLAWGTSKENARDKIGHGTSNDGEKNGNARLTSESVEIIRKLWVKGGLTQRQIGNMFGVDHRNISLIVNGKAWIRADLRARAPQ